ncbi:Fic family protein [Parahaliea aestuarii]|uniref:Fic family protein n=1 Tax=Parahaliea aestuarii TaxID=1852021 RepID=A0A5C8ZLF7_9GAMM|nr:Fic family protein [Parahaliea aestuarii]TXS89303.1 Fic family protein [Parahaliea aestuarii]
MREKAGYSWLIEQYQLPVIGLWQHCYIDSATKGRQSQDLGEHQLQLFAPNYQPEPEASAHLQFALRYEGLNLQALSLLFDQLSPDVLCDWILQNPTSTYARRGCFLYEWITGRRLPIDDPVPPKAKYVDIVDQKQEFTSGTGERVPRFRVSNNLPGTRAFCPMVRKTDNLKAMVNKDLRQRTREALARYDQDLLRRAAAFLYLKETQTSFEVERERPSPDRAQRFADLLRQADTGEPLTEDRLLELQNAIIDPRFHEFCWRHQQNWVGEDLGYRQRVEFVPARPEDLQDLMQGLLDTAAKARLAANAAGLENDKAGLTFDPVVYAAVIAFGFVFIHPFMDGNGRIHRYLIHEVLANAGFTPKGIVLPVSAVILAKLNEYVAVLQAFSSPLRERTQYAPATPDLPATGNDAVYFRFFDATVQAEFLYRALERTVEEDLQQEIVRIPLKSATHSI